MTLETPSQLDSSSWMQAEWLIDPTHSQVTFTIRHALVAVRCAFLDVSGAIHVGETPEESSVEALIKTDSFSSGFEYRDQRVRKFDDLLNSNAFPTIRYVSTRVTKAPEPDHYRISGDLTALGVTRPVELDTRFIGVGRVAEYGTRAGFLARTRLDRRDFGMIRDTSIVDSERPLGDGNRLLGWTIDVEINLEAVLTTDAGRYGLEKITGSPA
jgi:polyisoprenoid-binding protein YceI